MELHKRAITPFHELLVYEFILYHGMSYMDVALHLGVTEDYAYELLTGARKPDQEDLENLVSMLGISVTLMVNLTSN